MKTRIYTLLFAIVASVGTLFAESGTCGPNLTWNLTNGVLTISGTGDMGVFEDGDGLARWDSLRNSIQSVVIGNNVTSIGIWAFADCTGLTSVTIPSSVKSIGYQAFSGCNHLNAVHINDIAAWCAIDFETDISYDNIVDVNANPLKYAHNLYLNNKLVRNLIIPNGVTSINSSFYGCTSLISVTIPNSVTSIGSLAFSGCTSLTSVTLNSNAIVNNSDKSSIFGKRVIAYIIGDSVTNIGEYAFYNCSGLTSVKIGNGVTSIGEMAFEGCASLISVTIPNSVTSIGDFAFVDCSSLTSVTIPNSVTKIGDHAFCGCAGLTSITCEASIPPICKTNDVFPDVFRDVDKSIPIYVPTASVEAYKVANGWKNFANILSIQDKYTHIESRDCDPYTCQQTEPLTLKTTYDYYAQNVQYYEMDPNGYGWTELKDQTAYGNGGYNIKDAEVGTHVYAVVTWHYEINAPQRRMPAAQTGIPALPKPTGYGVWIDHYDVYYLTVNYNTEDHFYTLEVDPNIGTVDFTLFTTAGTIDPKGGKTFCGDNQKYSIAKGTTVNDIYTQGFIYQTGKDNLETITLEPGRYIYTVFIHERNVDGDKLAITWCDRFEIEVKAPANHSVTFLDKDGREIETIRVLSGNSAEVPEAPDVFGYTFTGWDKDLSNVTEDMIVTAQYTRDAIDGLYYIYNQEEKTATLDREGNNYARMTKLTVPNTITYRGTKFTVVAIGDHALEGCDRLTDVVIPNSVENIMPYAFAGCSDMMHLNLGGGIRSIADHAFDGCKRLEDITVYAERVPDLTATSFANVGNKKYIPVYVLEARLPFYQRDEYWSEFDLKVKSAGQVDDLTKNDVTVEPDDNSAIFTWPTSEDASTYTITITKDGEVFCTLIFNSNGQLSGIAFAPGRNESHYAPAAILTSNGGMQFTVTGLEIATRYGFGLTATNAEGQVLAEYSGTFGTTGASEGIEDVKVADKVQKVIRDGQIYIIRGDKTYTVQGQEVK